MVDFHNLRTKLDFRYECVQALIYSHLSAWLIHIFLNYYLK